MTTVVKAASAAQFLSLVPALLGCHPSRSLVLVPFVGSRSAGAMRFDLPDDDADLDRVAATFVGMSCRVPRVQGVAIVVYPSRAAGSDPAPHRRLVESVRARTDSCGLRVVDALWVAPDGWGSYLSPGPRRPLEELTGDAGADALGGIVAPGADQSAGAELPAADPAVKDDVERALVSLGDAVDVVCGPGEHATHSARATGRIDPRAFIAVGSLDDLPQFYENALGWDPDTLDPFDAAAMIWCLSRPSLRDVALVGWCGDLAAADEAMAAQLRWEDGEEYPVHLAMRMWGEGPRPDPVRMSSALALARGLAAVSPLDMRPGLLALCGWLSWGLGRSTHAARYALAAREIEPEHGLAEIVASFVQAGHLPEWAFERFLPVDEEEAT